VEEVAVVDVGKERKVDGMEKLKIIG